MEYTAVYEPDMQAFGILDLQLLSRYFSSSLTVDTLLKGSNIDEFQLNTPDTHITLAQKISGVQ